MAPASNTFGITLNQLMTPLSGNLLSHQSYQAHETIQINFIANGLTV